jgi:hypothetical protein
MTAPWEYSVVEEPNPVALQVRLGILAREGWEPIGLGYAGECRLLALLRRQAADSRVSPTESTASANARLTDSPGEP